MICHKCGADTPDKAAFCPQCGATLTTASAGTAAPSQPSGAQQLTGGRQPTVGNQPPERELWVGSYSPKGMAGAFIGAGLLSIAAIVLVSMSGREDLWPWVGSALLIIWAVLGLILVYRRAAIKYQLTTYRLFHEKGLLSRKRDRIEVIDIDDVTLTQGLIERLLNIGTIHIICSDESLLREQNKSSRNEKAGNQGAELLMPGIADVRHVADLIDNTRRAERNRRGVFLEHV